MEEVRAVIILQIHTAVAMAMGVDLEVAVELMVGVWAQRMIDVMHARLGDP